MSAVRLPASAAAMLLLAILLMGVAGCDQLAGKRAAVAVIDLDAVARALGRDDVITQRINDANQQLTTQLGQVAQNLQQQLAEAREKYPVVGDEAEAELQQKAAAATAQLQQTQRLAQQRSAQFRTAVINEFREEVQPFAAELAERRGAVAIMTVAAPMLWFDPAVDITGDVISAMRQAGLERSRAAGSAAGSASGDARDADSATDPAAGAAGGGDA